MARGALEDGASARAACVVEVLKSTTTTHVSATN